MKHKIPSLLLCLGMLWAAAGCAVIPAKPTAAEFRDSALAQAEAHEAAGDLVAALDKYRIALTVDGNNAAAAAGVQRTAQRLQASACRYYEAGVRLQGQGRYLQARQHFLTALRLWPEHAKALAALMERGQPSKTDYIVHVVQHGESLSQIAARYYGDHRKFDLIAAYNRISDAATIRAGQELKVPVQTGGTPEKDRCAGPPAAALNPAEAATPAGNQPGSDPGYETDQAAIYREQGIEMFEEGNYADAAVEFNKVLGLSPDDAQAASYCYQSYFRIAMKCFEDENYLGAIDGFTRSLAYERDCRQCHAYIEKSKSLYMENHYKLGMQHYSREQLLEAIQEWEKVKSIDPQYKKVDTLIVKAQTILKNLEEIKTDQR